jgi:hypothetical protein
MMLVSFMVVLFWLLLSFVAASLIGQWLRRNRERERFCYQCDEAVAYLFSDGRCASCTRVNPESRRRDD